MEINQTDKTSDSFSNSSSERRTSKRKRKETKFFTLDVGRKAPEFDVHLKCKVKNNTGFSGLSSSCNFSANSTWHASHLIRKISKEINLKGKSKLKVAYYDSQTKKWKKMTSVNQVLSLKNAKIRIYKPKEVKPEPQSNVQPKPTPSNTLVQIKPIMYQNQMYSPYDPYSIAWYNYCYYYQTMAYMGGMTNFRTA